MNFFFIFPIFFEFFDEGTQGVAFCQESPVKISAKTDNRAKSYGCFTEGVSESVMKNPGVWVKSESGLGSGRDFFDEVDAAESGIYENWSEVVRVGLGWD